MIVLDELLSLLRQDNTLMALLNVERDENNEIIDDKIYPLNTEFKGDCIVYTYTPLIADETTEQGRFEVNIISEDMFKALEILEQVKKCLITFGDELKTEHIFEISQNGGSTPTQSDIGTYHVFGFFSVKNYKY